MTTRMAALIAALSVAMVSPAAGWPLPDGGVAQERPSAGEIVAGHLASIGSPETRSAIRSRLARGTVWFTEAVSGQIRMPGAAELAAAGTKTSVNFEFGQPAYPGEKLVFDGRDVLVAQIGPGSRSSLGEFLYRQTEVLRDGLLGGTLVTGWSLLDLKGRRARVEDAGTERFDDRDLYAVTYVPRRRSGTGEMGIRLYFEPGTFHHVATVYTVLTRAIQDVEEIVEERFDDFQVVDGLTLPRRWEIRYRKEPDARPREYRYAVTLTSIVHNTIGQ
ncbi:MAG: hypothetical protein AB1806_00890 [Acidobacteriota bacterium]